MRRILRCLYQLQPQQQGSHPLLQQHRRASRLIKATKISESVTEVGVVMNEEERQHRSDSSSEEEPSCVLCSLRKQIAYHDVLILRQFLDNKGYVIDNALTGVCDKQQRILISCVRKAHIVGLLGPPKHERSYEEPFRYQQFNNYYHPVRRYKLLQSQGRSVPFLRNKDDVIASFEETASTSDMMKKRTSSPASSSSSQHPQ